MNKKQPFDEMLNRQLQDLPVPPVEESWQKMEQLLDGKKPRRRFLPLFFKWGGITVALLLLAAGGWLSYEYFIAPPSGNSTASSSSISGTSDSYPRHSNNNTKPDQKNYNSGAQHSAASTTKANSRLNDASSHSKQTIQHSDQKQMDKTSEVIARDATVGVNVQKRSSKELYKSKRNINTKTIVTSNRNIVQHNISGPDGNGTYNKNTTATSNKPVSSRRPKSRVTASDNNVTNITQQHTKTSTLQEAESHKQTAITTDVMAQDDPSQLQNFTDTIATIAAPQQVFMLPVQPQPASSDTVNKQTDSVNLTKNKNSILKKQLKLSFSLGIAEQQAIPIGGQKLNSYGANGKGSMIGDYIPSVYIRVNKGKWFLHGEFKYAAPQLVNDISYQRRTRYDKVSRVLTVNHQYIKKAYYHQFPVSLNYNVKPNLSIGAGVQFNLLHSTITETNLFTQNFISNSKSTATNIRADKGFTDSFFYSNQMQFLIEGEYRIKRFSFGLRYARGLQPYLSYITPSGEAKSETLQSLNILIRYRLWQWNTK